MRKLAVVVLVFISTIMLVACNEKFYATATVDQIERTVTEIKTSIEIKDPNSQVESKIYFYLYSTDEEAKQVDTKNRTLQQLEDADNIVTFFNLEENKTYRLSIETTWSGKTRNLFNGNIETVVKANKEINNEQEFLEIAKIERENKTRTIYDLKADLDFTNLQDEVNKNLIGTFRGEFLGNDHTIKNYHVNSSTNSSMGLFAQVSSNAVIKDLKVDNYTYTQNFRQIDRKEDDGEGNEVVKKYVTPTTTSSYVGVLFGQNSSDKAVISNIEITNSKLDLNINSGSTYTNFGVLGGTVSGTVQNIKADHTNELKITLKEHNMTRIGGLIGEIKKEAQISEIYSAVNLTVNVEQERIVLPEQIKPQPVAATEKEAWELDEIAGGGLVGKDYVHLYVGGFAGTNEDAKVTNVVSNANILIEKLNYVVYSKGTETTQANNDVRQINVIVGGLYGKNHSKNVSNHLYGGNIDIQASLNVVDELDAKKPHVYVANLIVGGLIGSAKGFTHKSVTNFARTNGTINIVEQLTTTKLELHKIYGAAGEVKYDETTVLGIVGTLNDLYNGLPTEFDIDASTIYVITDLEEFFKDNEWILALI